MKYYNRMILLICPFYEIKRANNANPESTMAIDFFLCACVCVCAGVHQIRFTGLANGKRQINQS